MSLSETEQISSKNDAKKTRVRNKEAELEYLKKWQAKNKDKVKAYQRKYYDARLAKAGKLRREDRVKPSKPVKDLGDTYYARNRERVLSRVNSRRLSMTGEGYQHVLLTNAVHRAARRNLVYSISFASVEWSSRCNICSSELTYTGGKKLPRNSPTIDRIDNSKGYEPGNVQILCKSCNSLKGTK